MRLPLPQFAAGARQANHIGEVIETSTTEFLAQCLDPEDLSFPVMPAFGSWVKSVDEESGNQIFAVIYHATTSPIDTVHRARALGMTLDELREEQPQIFAMLKTEFRSAIVGFQASGEKLNGYNPTVGKSYQYLPPRPPQIHQAVYQCEPAEILYFSEELDFLRTLLQVVGVPVEALTAATIRQIYQLRQGDRDWLVKAGRSLNLILKDDYDRLRYILTQLHF